VCGVFENDVIEVW